MRLAVTTVHCFPNVLTGLYQLSVELLQNLAKVPRFGMIAMFLSPKEKQGKNLVQRSEAWGYNLEQLLFQSRNLYS